MTKLTNREFTDNIMLMCLVSGDFAGHSNALERILASKPEGPDRTYNVEIKIDGVEVDFRDFAALVHRQLDDMTMRAARDLIDERIKSHVTSVSDALCDIERQAKDLAIAIEAEARKAWGMPMRGEED